MRIPTAVLGVVLASATTAAAEPGWHSNLESAKKEAKTTGRAIFLVTIWKRSV